jgi:hypothetical protein
MGVKLHAHCFDRTQQRPKIFQRFQLWAKLLAQKIRKLQTNHLLVFSHENGHELKWDREKKDAFAHKFDHLELDSAVGNNKKQ